jgi:hypothetical protein
MRLPDELLLTILDDLDLSDLYSLALLSKRLHILALQRYFTVSARSSYWVNQGFSAWRSYAHMDHRGPRADKCLHVLRLALFVTQLDILSCTLTMENMGHARGILRLTSKLTRISCIYLNIGQLVGARGRELFRILVAILDMLPSKFCTSLDLVGCMRGPILDGNLMVQPRPLLTLRTFSIRSAISVSALSPWFFSTVNESRISSLTIGPTDMTTSEWKSTFSRISNSSFSTVVVTTPNIHCDDLYKFLKRHPNIGSLTMSCSSPSMGAPFPPRGCSSIRQLGGNPCVIKHFLTPRGALPELQVVHIGTTSAVDLDSLLCQVARHESIRQLCLYTPCGPDWLTGRNMAVTRLTNVSSVVICNFQNALSLELAIWLTSFPALKSVDFFFGLQYSDAWRREFVKRVIDRNSTITSMSFGGGAQPLENFLL